MLEQYSPVVRIIPLTLVFSTQIDEADFELVGAYSWYSMKLKNTTYARSGTNLFMHRLIMNPSNHEQVDHLNGDGLDNRRMNLRVCTRSQNVQNRHKVFGMSRFQGVYRDSRRTRWTASIICCGVTYRLGTFANEEEAARAYDRKAKELFGPFARVNFSEGD